MIREAFNKKRSLFIPFVMSGYPDMEISTQAIMALADVGADIIELGVPFSDPIADGPINQSAAEVALANGASILGAIEQIKRVRMLGCDTPIIIFSYFNPIMACNDFLKLAKNAKADGVLIVDLPPEEGRDFYMDANKQGLEIILLMSPTTDHKRMHIYKELQPSFIYYISRLAVTGVQQELSKSLNDELFSLRKILPDNKIAVGFGITTPQQAQEVAQIADGVIIGSKLVATLASEGIDKFTILAKQLAKAIHG